MISSKFLFILVQFVNLFYTWDISIKDRNDVILRHVSLYYLRAFLCVESVMNRTTPTLLESTWPENIVAIRPKPFPNKNAHINGNNETDCTRLHHALSSDVDGNGNLWVLDIGNGNCSPKLVIYDLDNKNTELLRSNLPDNRNLKLLSIKIDPFTTNTIDHRAFIIAADVGYLLTFSYETKTWGETPVTPEGNWPVDRLHPIEIAFTLDKRFYIADQLGHLYLADDVTNINTTGIQGNYLGMLLDKPKGLITDGKGFLYYVLPRFGAVVRWNPTRALNAEGHEIIKFHTENIIQIIFGVKGSVWIIKEKASTSRDHCTRLMYHYSNNIQL